MKDLIKVNVEKVIVDDSIGEPVVILRSAEDDAYLPISIGYAEAQSILFALEDIKPERPITHDLLLMVLKGSSLHITRVVINQLKNSTFFARLILEGEQKVISIDARPSDCIAVAIRAKAPIYVASYVMAEASQRHEG